MTHKKGIYVSQVAESFQGNSRISLLNMELGIYPLSYICFMRASVISDRWDRSSRSWRKSILESITRDIM